jgi:serine/threonine protein kinase
VGADVALLRHSLPQEETDGRDTRSTTETSTGLTSPGVLMGTVGYMSPEQVRGQEADARSDIFALGAILYEMLSGQRAFQGNSEAETIGRSWRGGAARAPRTS